MLQDSSSVLFPPFLSPDGPNATGCGQPGYGSASQDQPRRVARKEHPCQPRKQDQAEATHGGPHRLQCCRVPATLVSVQSFLRLLFPFVFLNQGGRGRKNCRERQEQSADGRTELSGNPPRRCRDHAAVTKAHTIFIPSN